MSEVPSQEDSRPEQVAGEQEYIVTIQLVGYGKPDQVKKDIQETLRRVLPLEFGPLLKACRVTPASSIRLD